MTVSEALQRASLLLREAGLREPRREAAALLCAALHKPPAWVYAHGEETLDPAAAALFFAWTERRRRREPYAYLTGEREFMGLPFAVTPAVLIPRPETEVLVTVAAGILQNHPAPHILDVGTGSGVIACVLALQLPAARVCAVDISREALLVAARNAARHGVAERIRFLQGDLYAPVAGEQFSAVVSNPPYIPAGEIGTLEPDVRDYEPRAALDGGPDGLHFYRRLTAELPKLGCRPQLLCLEVGFGQAEAVAEMCRACGFARVDIYPDLAGIPRVVAACCDESFSGQCKPEGKKKRHAD
ncbi:MAG: peptide chain release factor N(5)-glutamine methyltransferase [Firmicutes bacterium]|nr:peptide chain release factor N(5)-glutamine methyltransferase [Bacillota bacterium]